MIRSHISAAPHYVPARDVFVFKSRTRMGVELGALCEGGADGRFGALTPGPFFFADATDDLAQQSRIDEHRHGPMRTLTMSLRGRGRSYSPPPAGAAVAASDGERRASWSRWSASTARASGRSAERRFAPGPVAMHLEPSGPARRPAAARSYVVRIAATNRLGVLDVLRRFTARFVGC